MRDLPFREKFRRASLAAVICLAASFAQAGGLEVSVQGMRNEVGFLRVAICKPSHFLKPACALGAAAPAAQGRGLIEDIPPGRYAVQAHHDENADGRIDRGAFGRPLEGIGFSRDAPMRFGPPDFDDAAIRIPEGRNALSLTMRYFN